MYCIFVSIARVTTLRSRWELITSALGDPLMCVEDLEEAILSYNSRFKEKWHFNLLKGVVNH